MTLSASMRSIRAPLWAIIRRQYSATIPASYSKTAAASQVVGHSNKKLAIVSGVSAAVGVDITYAYFTFFRKNQ
ncbi:hypothetical protein BGX28_009676 [Mortierella sp. GBA30]|nr:hypothetical protein BGX28_009676 [Mortierella sp. GBA30]